MDISACVLYFALFDVVVQWSGFIVSAILQTEKFFDFVGSRTFFGLATISLGLGGVLHERQVMVTTLVSVWSVRLGTFLLMRILMAGHDSRFDGVRNHPPMLFGYWTIQAIWIFGVSLPVILVNLSSENLPWLTPTDTLGMLLWGVGFLLETVADYQKHVFRGDDANKGKWIDSGLWRLSRHPNYVGEIMLWWGVYLTAYGGLKGWRLLGAISPCLTTFMLLCVSGVPMLEKSADSKWGGNPAYAAYKKRTPLLVSWPFTEHKHRKE